MYIKMAVHSIKHALYQQKKGRHITGHTVQLTDDLWGVKHHKNEHHECTEFCKALKQAQVVEAR